MADLDDLADELYAIAPDEFTAERDRRARDLRASDRDLSAQVKALRRPSPAAWLVNQFVRHRADELAALLDLADDLREAQQGLDARELTRLAGERRKLVAAMARQAGELADDLRNPVRAPVLDEVAQTLQAAMADAAAADAVRTGRLLRALEAVGTEVDLDGAVAGSAPGAAAPRGAKRATSGRTSTAGAAPARPAKDDLARRRAEKAAEREAEARRLAEQAAAEAEREADEAERDASAAEAHAAELEQRVADRTGRRDELEAELARVEAELAEAERERRTATRERDRAVRYAASARQTADDARTALE